MSYAKSCAQCERDFVSRRPDAETCSEECKYQNWIERSVLAAQPVTHPLQLVRDKTALDKHTRDLNGLIRQAIIDAVKTAGECHADDLIPLSPIGEVDRCRELATRQFASLRSGKSPVISERERRASSIPTRKGGKSGVYVFTRYGREQLVGLSSGASGGTGVATAQSSEKVGLSAAAQLGGPAESGRSAEPGDLTLDAGQHPGKCAKGGSSSSSVAGIETPEPLEVLQLEIPQESGSSAYGVVVEDAA